MKQQTLAMAQDQGFEQYRKPTRCDQFLETMNRVIPWEALCAVVEPYYPEKGNGRPPIGLERMLRIHFLQHWFNLADLACEEALYDSASLRRFSGIYKVGSSYKDAVHPVVIAKDLSDFLYRGNLPKDQTLVCSGGFGIARYTRRWLRAYRPAQIMNGQYQFGTVGSDVGYSVGAGIAVKEGHGVQAAYEGHPIITIMGDAAFGFSGMEMETLANYRVPAIIIVYNNNAWGTWYLQGDKPRRVPMHLFQENIRYDKMAEALGANGLYVTKPEDFLPALKGAYKAAVDTSMPTLINVQGKKEFWLREKYPPGFLGKIEPGVTSYYH